MKLESNGKTIFKVSIGKENRKFTFKGPKVRLAVNFSSATVDVRVISGKD